MKASNTNHGEITAQHPWPAEWRGVTKRLRQRFFLFAFISTLLIALGALIFPFSMLGLVTIFSGLAVACADFAVYRYSTSGLRRGMTGIALDNGKIFLPADHLTKLFLQLASAALLMAAAAAFLTAALEDFTTNRHDRQFLLVALIIGPVVAIWMAARLLSRPLFRRSTKMGVALSDYGVHHTSWWGESRYRWSHIQNIRIHRGTARTAFTHRPKDGNHLIITLALTPDGKSSIKGGVLSSPIRHWGPVMRNLTTINAAALDVYPPIVAHVITFYFEHPELRSELGTEKALERIRTGNFEA